MASAPGRGNLHAPPRGLQQPSSPAAAHTSRTSPSRLSHGGPRATPGGSAPRDRGYLIDKGDDEAAGERLGGARRRRGATASRCAGRVVGRVCARCGLPMRLMRQLDMGRELVHTWPCKVAVRAARVAWLAACGRDRLRSSCPAKPALSRTWSQSICGQARAAQTRAFVACIVRRDERKRMTVY